MNPRAAKCRVVIHLAVVCQAAAPQGVVCPKVPECQPVGCQAAALRVRLVLTEKDVLMAESQAVASVVELVVVPVVTRQAASVNFLATRIGRSSWEKNSINQSATSMKRWARNNVRSRQWGVTQKVLVTVQVVRVDPSVWVNRKPEHRVAAQARAVPAVRAVRLVVRKLRKVRLMV